MRHNPSEPCRFVAQISLVRLRSLRPIPREENRLTCPRTVDGVRNFLFVQRRLVAEVMVAGGTNKESPSLRMYFLSSPVVCG